MFLKVTKEIPAFAVIPGEEFKLQPGTYEVLDLDRTERGEFATVLHSAAGDTVVDACWFSFDVDEHGNTVDPPALLIEEARRVG